VTGVMNVGLPDELREGRRAVVGIEHNDLFHTKAKTVTAAALVSTFAQFEGQLLKYQAGNLVSWICGRIAVLVGQALS